MANSVLRNRLIVDATDALREAVQAQKAGAVKHPDGHPRLIAVRVPQWYCDALASIQGGSPKFLGRPVLVGEHEEINAVFWDPTMALDAEGAVL